jgi:hypothetical protein
VCQPRGCEFDYLFRAEGGALFVRSVRIPITKN